METRTRRSSHLAWQRSRQRPHDALAQSHDHQGLQSGKQRHDDAGAAGAKDRRKALRAVGKVDMITGCSFCAVSGYERKSFYQQWSRQQRGFADVA